MITVIPNLPPLITPLYAANRHSSFVSPLTSPLGRRRRHFQLWASSLVFPLLPFPADQVLIPSEAKSLHLYEARYIALLKESLLQKNKLFVHFVLDPIGFGGTSAEALCCPIRLFGHNRGSRTIRYWSIGPDKGCRSSKAIRIQKALSNFTMVRSKIKYELIADERTRRETFKKRKSGLFKKLHELKTLCDVEACGIIINEDGSQSDVWPSVPVTSLVVRRFLNLPSSSQTNNMVGQSGFLKHNLSRISNNLDKETRKVQSLEKELVLAEYLAKERVDVSNSNELQEMLHLLEKKIQQVNRKIANIGPSSSNMIARARGRNHEFYHGKGKQPI